MLKDHSVSNPTRRCGGFALSSAVLAAAFLGNSATAQASLAIQATFDSTITSDANAAAIQGVINSAIGVYQSTFADPITVKIKFAEMTTGLGQSSSWQFNNAFPYADLRGSMAADATTSDDITAFNSLPATNPIPGNSSSNMTLKTANFKAFVGGSVTTPDGFDGTVSLNTHLTDIGSPGTTGEYSLSAVVEHEINEVLGLGSGLGDNLLLPQDLFRFTQAGARTYSTAGDDAYFSINGGATFLARFNQDSGGDYGDWWSAFGVLTPQVQDAFSTPGSHPVLGNAELTALDVIGYDRVTPVPIPAAGWLFVSAVGGLLAIRRRTSISA